MTIAIDQQIQVIEKEMQIRTLLKTTQGKRVIPLPAFIADLLKQHHLEHLAEFDPALMWTPNSEKHNWVFTQTHHPGKPITPYSDRTSWKLLLERAGIPHVKPYITRHTAASMLIAHGVDIATVAEILGHTDPAFTLRTYGHSIAERKREAVNLLDAAFSARQPASSPPETALHGEDKVPSRKKHLTKTTSGQ